MTATSAEHGARYLDSLVALEGIVEQLLIQKTPIDSIRVQAREFARIEAPLLDSATVDRKVFQVSKRFNGHAAAFSPKPLTAAEILRTDYPALRWTVDDILPEGLILLAARPKIGKSWLAMQIALAVANGADVLNRNTAKGSALVLALDDNNVRRLQQRLFKYRAGYWADQSALTRVEFATDWRRADDGGLEDLLGWLNSRADARLIVIDTLERFRAKRTERGNSYAEDYAALHTIKTLCDARQITVLVVHHTRKAAAEDPIDSISGTLGLGGAADGALVITRARGSEQAELHLIGRDIASEGAYAVRFDRASCLWQMEGSAAEVMKSRERQQIRDALKARGALMPVALAEEIERPRPVVRKLLRKMLNDGELLQAADGSYYIQEHPIQERHKEQKEQEEQGAQARAVPVPSVPPAQRGQA